MRRGFRLGLALLLVLLLVLGGAGLARVNSFSEATSGKGLLTSDIQARAEKAGRFNLLVMGFGGKGQEGANLTDSILIYSVPLDGEAAGQVSVPRDLWLEAPAGSGQFRKANAAYAVAVASTGNRRKGANAAAQSIGRAVGLPIHGWMTVDFGGFRDLVDALGGVDIEVKRFFVARYPDPKRPFKWTRVRFEKGRQHMDGERAIQYARARYVVGGAAQEGTDFARAARQQQLVAAIKRKLLSPAGIARGFGVASAVEDEVQTNVSASDLARIFRRPVDPRRQVVLSPANVLAESSTADGQFILVPQGGDYGAIHRHVRSSLQGRDTARR